MYTLWNEIQVTFLEGIREIRSYTFLLPVTLMFDNNNINDHYCGKPLKIRDLNVSRTNEKSWDIFCTL